MHSLRQRDLDTQTGEALEIAVEGAERGIVLDADRGQMRIGDQITAATGADQQSRQHRRMAAGRMQQARADG